MGLFGRITTGIFTLGISEGIRAIDEDTAEALEGVNPIGNFGDAAIRGDGLGAVVATLNPVNRVAALAKTAERATRNVPVVKEVTSATHGFANCAATVTNTPVDFLGNYIKPGRKETPSGYAYACAGLSHRLYCNRYGSWYDREGDEWKSIKPDVTDGYNEEDTAVAQNGKTIIITFRATKMNKSDDINADKDILLGSEWSNRRFNRGKNFLHAMMNAEKYNGIKFYVTGHSLGGAIAYYAAKNVGGNCEAHIFNAGAGPCHEMFTRGRKSVKVTHHKIRNDVIACAFTANGITEKYYNNSEKMHAHLLHHFLLERDH